MMKLMKFIFVLAFLVMAAPQTYAYEGVVASEDQIEMLKNDLLDGVLYPGDTRLKDVRRLYGDAPTIRNTDKKVNYDYGLIQLVWVKKKVWKYWEYDSFKKPVYNDSVDDLRFDLESKALTGKNITLKKIIRNYDIPTESMETDEDGEMSIYYYGNIKLIFENQVVLQSWKGQNLGDSPEKK